MENQTRKSLIKDAVTFAFNAIFDHMLSWLAVWLSIIGFGLLGVLGSAVLIGLGCFLTYSLMMPGFYFYGSIAAAAIFMLLYIPSLHLGLTRTLLTFGESRQITFKPYFSVPAIFSFAISLLFLSVLTALGLALFIIPGLIVMIRTMFTTFFIVDKHLGPIAAIQASWDLTRGQYNTTIGLTLICLLMNMVPFVGWLMTGLMIMYVYRELTNMKSQGF